MILPFISVFLVSLFLQNLVLNSGFGLEAILRTGQKPTRVFRISLLLTFFSAAATLLGWPFHRLLHFGRADIPARLFLFLFFLCLLYSLTAWFHHHRKKHSGFSLFTTNDLITAAFSNLVAMIPFLACQTALDLGAALLLSVYSGLGFLLAAWIFAGSSFLLQSARIPASFRGAPVRILYLAILLMAFAGFTGALS